MTASLATSAPGFFQAGTYAITTTHLDGTLVLAHQRARQRITGGEGRNDHPLGHGPWSGEPECSRR
jgi:hypothetical protein